MNAVQLMSSRSVYSDAAYAELRLWRMPAPLAGSGHEYRYRLAYVVKEVCVLRYDNETGKGDHRRVDGRDRPYVFKTPEKLMADFQRDMARWNHENRDT